MSTCFSNFTHLYLSLIFCNFLFVSFLIFFKLPLFYYLPFDLLYEVSLFMKIKDHRVLRVLFDLFGHRQCLVEFELELSHKFLLICGSRIERSCFIVQVGDFSLFEEHLLLFIFKKYFGLDLGQGLLRR